MDGALDPKAPDYEVQSWILARGLNGLTVTDDQVAQFTQNLANQKKLLEQSG